MPRPTAKVFPALSRTTHAHNNFTNPPLVNIFLTTPNAPFIKATKNFLFSLEVALPFTFLLLKRLSLNRSIPFCVSKKNLSTLWKFLNLFSHWLTSFSSRISYFPLYNLVRFQFCFILTISPEECQMKSFGKKRLSVDFKGPFPGKNKYFLFVVDEFSRFPFAFPCKDMSSTTVISCLSTLFNIFGLPLYVHSDRVSNFISRDVRQYLNDQGVATSRSTPYYPSGNAQCERVNQTVWKTVKLMLRNLNLPEPSWETVLPQSLPTVRSLLFTTTNATPHERFFNFHRRSMLGRSLPNCNCCNLDRYCCGVSYEQRINL